MTHLFEAALYVGRLGREVTQRHARRARANGDRHVHPRRPDRRRPPDILLVYPEGNYIQASDERPFLQIGESKYGKFMLELGVHAHVDIETAHEDRPQLDDEHRPRQPLGRPAVRRGIYRNGRVRARGDPPRRRTRRCSPGFRRCGSVT